MNPLEFEKIVKELDRNKYHICRMLGFKDNEPIIIEWEIFRKDMPEAEYFSAGNKAKLSSKNGDTIEDIKKLIEYEREKNHE